ncbi:MAG: hypothetical protein FGM61_11900 [Sediminibacterium sp.]|nr:hypothetical protein [Sediminibacterium sp.]
MRRKFGMQPFRLNTLYSILLGIIAFAISYIIALPLEGWPAIIVKSVVFSGIMLIGIFYGKLTPDAHQLWEVGRNRWKKFRN